MSPEWTTINTTSCSSQQQTNQPAFGKADAAAIGGTLSTTQQQTNTPTRDDTIIKTIQSAFRETFSPALEISHIPTFVYSERGPVEAAHKSTVWATKRTPDWESDWPAFAPTECATHNRTHIFTKHTTFNAAIQATN
jgi:hypothetical protein